MELNMALKTILLIFLWVWVAFIPLTYAAMFAYYQKGFPDIAKKWYWQDLTIAAIGATIFGPIGLSIIYRIGWSFRKHGLKFF